MADLKALEKTMNDAAALAAARVQVYKDKAAQADTAKAKKDAKVPALKAAISKHNALVEEAKKVEADGETAKKKANEAREAAKKVKDAENKKVAELLEIAKAATTQATNAKTAYNNALKAEKTATDRKKAAEAVKATGEKKKAAEAARDKAWGDHKAANKKMADGSKAAYDKAVAAAKDVSNKAYKDKTAAFAKVKPAREIYDKAKKEYDEVKKDWSSKCDSRWTAYSALKDAEKATKAAKEKYDEAAKKAGIAQKVIDSTADGVKLILGGVTGSFQWALEKIANFGLIKGTKVGTAVDLSNCLVDTFTKKLPDFLMDIGIDTLAGLASAIYCGKSIGQVYESVLSAAKKSAKGNWTNVCDKTMAVLQAYDPDLTSDDLKEYFKGMKEYIKAKAS